MTTSCSACGVVVAPNSRFCHACGRPQPSPALALLSPRFNSPVAYTPRHLAERILHTRSALEGEHKRVTVLFCDIVDSTTLAERVGAERMHEILQRFFDIALEEVHRYEGTINQFLGDGFMALFGAPLALEHHEREAVLAAVGVVARVRLALTTSEPEAIALRIRIGINTGPVVVGKIGDNLRMDYTAIGDTTNVAARLQAAAERGGILISESTWERARDVIQARAEGALIIHGKTEPVSAYTVLGLRVDNSAAIERSPTQFVGRALELEELREALDHAEQSRGQVVTIVGEPGMGKSRLLREFRRTLEQRNVTCLEGACLSYGSTIPYLPILDLVRGACDVVDGDTPESVAAKATRLMNALGADPAATVPYLLYLLGVKERTGPLDALTPETIKSRTIEVLREVVLRASRRRTLVLFIEDMHWIDQASEQLLSEVVDVLPATAVLLVATHRPGYSAAWIQRSYTTQIALRRLSDRDALTLVTHLAGAHAPSVDAPSLVARGEGNPLFLEELVHTMQRAPHSDLGGIPETLLGVLTARVDRIPDDAKTLLQMAAVVGRAFSPSLLRQLVPDPTGLDARLRELTQLEFLHQLSVGPDPEYAFKHVLTRDAVYQSMLRRRRRIAHSAVGRALEQQYDGRISEVVELLAYHFDLGDDDERAVDYAIQAAERAQHRWANVEAVTFFERALARLEAAPDTEQNRLRRIDAITKQAEVLFALGRHRDHVAVLESIRGIVATADVVRRATWSYWLGFLQCLTGAQLDTAIAHCRTASELAQSAGLPRVRGYADTGLAQAYVFAGELRPAIEAGERALRFFEREGDPWWASRALAQLSPTANHLGEWERGLHYCHRMTELGAALDDLRLKVSALVRTAATHVYRGDSRTAQVLCEAALALHPTPYDAAAVRAVSGYACVKSGEIASGTAQLTEALAFYERSQLRYTGALFGLWLADAYTRNGAPHDAQRILARILETTRELGYRHVEGMAERLLGEAISSSDAGEATAHLDRAETILRECDARNELAKVLVARACLKRQAPDRHLLEQALADFRALGTLDEPVRVERILRENHA
jgi:class 3 adenylate cyclase/tetratricopeptide (TPR) repeat protein